MAGIVSHWPDVRDKLEFLHRLMVELAGDARISLEGDLSCCRFPDDLVVSRREIGVLTRRTLFPRQDFVVLRLTPDTIREIFQISEAGLTQSIIHVQIERGGELELGAYDNFAPGCVWTGPGVKVELLDELKSKGVLRDFEIAAPNAQDFTESPIRNYSPGN